MGPSQVTRSRTLPCKGHEGDEGKEGQQADGQGRRLPRWQHGRRHNAHEGGPYQEQGREGREQEAGVAGQEDVRKGDRQVDCSRAEGSEALGTTGFVAVKKGSPLYKKAREFF